MCGLASILTVPSCSNVDKTSYTASFGSDNRDITSSFSNEQYESSTEVPFSSFYDSSIEKEYLTDDSNVGANIEPSNNDEAIEEKEDNVENVSTGHNEQQSLQDEEEKEENVLLGLPNDDEDEITSEETLKTNNSDSFIFFTDPHLFEPFSGSSIDENWFNSFIPMFQSAYAENDSNFIMCGGDLLNHGDSREDAFNKLSYFSKRMKGSFEHFYTIVGNHDTNYQGDTFIESRDSLSCRLTQQELQKALFKGRKSYYFFDTKLTRHYCFDSGIDWDSAFLNRFRNEQIKWFANDLKLNNKQHITIFIHIAFTGIQQKPLSALLSNLGTIIKSYNERKSVSFLGHVYDYKKAKGHIDFIQSGHEHIDINNRFCGGVPIITTRTFASSNATFDSVFVDYDESVITCTRYGIGEDRSFNFNFSDNGEVDNR